MAFRGFLPEAPSFGTQLARGLGGGFGQGIGRSAEMAGELHKEKSKQASLASLLGAGGNSEGKFKPMAPQQEAMLALSNPQAFNAYKTLKDDFVKQEEKTNALKPAYEALTKMEEMISKPGIGLLGSINPGEKARENRGRFKSLQASVLPLFKSMFPRGMTEKEFSFIQKHYIPQPGDSEKTIRGKISGLKDMFPSEFSSFESKISELPKEQMVKVQAPGGAEGQIPKSEVQNFLKKYGNKGGRVIR